MATLREQADKWKRLLTSLPALGLALGKEYAQTAVSLRKESSIEEGINKDGKPGNKAAYSDKTVPSYLLKGKELNQSGRSYLDKNKSANWYGLRQAQGLRSPVVNLDYTGKLWQAYGVLSVTVTNGTVTAQVGLSSPKEAAIFAYNIKRYGKFYQNTPLERERLRANHLQARISQWLTE